MALDAQLARLAVLPAAARRAPLADLAAQVVEVETAATRLAALNTDVLSPRRLSVDDPAVFDLTQRVDRLADAHRELDALDIDAGLAVPQVRPAPAPAPPAAAPATAPRPGTGTRLPPPPAARPATRPDR